MKFYSHITSEKYIVKRKPGLTIKRSICSGFTLATVAKVRADKGYRVKSFSELVKCIAELGSRNSRFNLLFRGQGNDYKDSNNRTKLYPSIYRPVNSNGRLSTVKLQKRLKNLKELIYALSKNRKNLGLSGYLLKHQEYWEAIIQHYNLCPTRLLDLTQSIRVAATFALYDINSNKDREDGFVYVLGFPHPNGSISTYADDELILVRLQSVCPPEAYRPHFQEGFLAGRWPRSKTKDAEANFAYWLLAKYRLTNKNNKFFDKEFPPIPYRVLIPEKDPFKDKLLNIINHQR